MIFQYQHLFVSLEMLLQAFTSLNNSLSMNYHHFEGEDYILHLGNPAAKGRNLVSVAGHFIHIGEALKIVFSQVSM